MIKKAKHVKIYVSVKVSCPFCSFPINIGNHGKKVFGGARDGEIVFTSVGVSPTRCRACKSVFYLEFKKDRLIVGKKGQPTIGKLRKGGGIIHEKGIIQLVIEEILLTSDQITIL